MAGRRSFARGVAPVLLAAAICSVPTQAGSEDLAGGQLLIRGATLVVSPVQQEIDPGRPTVVHTVLGDLEPGQSPAGMRVEGELSGPGLDTPLHLSTVPGEPFQVPGLNREGTYTLGSIRLTRDGAVLMAAEPSSVEILVHRLVIASITSRPLTPDHKGARADTFGIFW